MRTHKNWRSHLLIPFRSPTRPGLFPMHQITTRQLLLVRKSLIERMMIRRGCEKKIIAPSQPLEQWYSIYKRKRCSSLALEATWCSSLLQMREYCLRHGHTEESVLWPSELYFLTGALCFLATLTPGKERRFATSQSKQQRAAHLSCRWGIGFLKPERPEFIHNNKVVQHLLQGCKTTWTNLSWCIYCR